MSRRTIFLSKLIGLYCLLIGLAMAVNEEAWVIKVNSLLHDPGAVMIAAVFALAVGLAMILTHNVWSGGALPVVVTLIGWGSLIKGIFLLWLPPAAVEGYMNALHYQDLYYVYAGVTLLLGAYLTYGGFKSQPRA
jgi:hypothetical protein